MAAAAKPMPQTEPQLTITRTFDAPRDQVWKAWTDIEQLKRWWGPKGLDMQTARLDLRPGGVFHYAMCAVGGQPMWGKFVYRDIVAPQRLSFVSSFSDENQGVTRHPMSATWPLETLSTVEFSEQAGKTTLSLTGVPINATETERATFAAGTESMQKGFAGTMDQLDEHLAKA